MGWFEVEEYEPEEPAQATPEELAWERAKKLLNESDWTMLLDAPLKAQERKMYEEYRKDLRNIKDQRDFPHNIKWPVKPL
jgi:hypothetical protein